MNARHRQRVILGVRICMALRPAGDDLQRIGQWMVEVSPEVSAAFQAYADFGASMKEIECLVGRSK